MFVSSYRRQLWAAACKCINRVLKRGEGESTFLECSIFVQTRTVERSRARSPSHCIFSEWLGCIKGPRQLCNQCMGDDPLPRDFSCQEHRPGLSVTTVNSRGRGAKQRWTRVPHRYSACEWVPGTLSSMLISIGPEVPATSSQPPVSGHQSDVISAAPRIQTTSRLEPWRVRYIHKKVAEYIAKKLYVIARNEE